MITTLFVPTGDEWEKSHTLPVLTNGLKQLYNILLMDTRNNNYIYMYILKDRKVEVTEIK